MISTINSLILKILKNQFLAGSLIMVIGSNLYNFSQLLYHFLAGRFLGKASYGDLATIISILGFIGIIQMAFNLTIVKFIASEKDSNKISGFIRWVYKWSLVVGLVITILLITVAKPVSEFLNISNILYVILLGPIIVFFITAANGRSILQGLLKFDQYVSSLLSEGFTKILFAVIFFTLGYAIFGALIAFLGGVLLSFLVTTYLLRRYINNAEIPKINIFPLLKYSSAVLVQAFALTSMYSTDLIIVKHFLSAEQAGLYAALGILGRVVFFGATPVVSVMFPLIARKYLNGENYLGILYLSLLLILLFSLGVTGFYYFFPDLPLGFLYGKNFLDGASLLWLFAVFMGLLSIAMLLTQFFLSLGNTKVVYFFVLAAILQGVLVWFFHDTLSTVIEVSIMTSALLVLCLFVYFFYSFYLRTKK